MDKIVVARVYISVPDARMAEALDLVRGDACRAYELERPAFGLGPHFRILVVTIQQESSRWAVKERHRDVTTILQQGGIPHRLLAVDPAASPVEDQDLWHMVRDVSQVGPLRRGLAELLGVMKGPKRKRFLGIPILGTSTIIATAVGEDANERRLALHAARGEATTSSWLLRQYGNPRPLRAHQRPDTTLWPLIVSWLLIITGAVLLATFGIGPRAWLLILDLLLVACAAAIQVLWRTRTSADQQRVLPALVFGGVVAGYVALAVINPAVNDSAQATLTGVSLVLLITLFGLNFKLRAWRVSRLLPWITPIVLSVAAVAMPAVGYLTYALYLDALDIPHDALSYTTVEQAVAGAAPMLTWGVIAGVAVAAIGLLQWAMPLPKGSADSGVVVLVLVALISSVFHSGDSAVTAAKRGASTGLPASWYAIDPVLACFSTPPHETPIYGGPFDPGRPHVLLGSADDQWLVWDQGTYWRIPTDAVRVDPVERATPTCEDWQVAP